MGKTIGNELNQGNSVILLTQFMDNNRNDSSRVSFAELESVFKHRQGFHATQA